MKNYVQPGDNITSTAPADIASGDGVLIGSLFGVANGAAATGEPVVIVTKGVFTLPKNTTTAITEGALIYWDDTNERVTTTASGNTLIGHAVSAAGNPSNDVNVRLSV